MRRHMIPLAGAVASFSAIQGQDEFALGNDANILGIVTVWRYDSALGVGGKQDITVLCLQFERVEGPVKWREIAQQFRKMRHAPYLRPFESSHAFQAAFAAWHS